MICCRARATANEFLRIGRVAELVRRLTLRRGLYGRRLVVRLPSARRGEPGVLEKSRQNAAVFGYARPALIPKFPSKYSRIGARRRVVRVCFPHSAMRLTANSFLFNVKNRTR